MRVGTRYLLIVLAGSIGGCAVGRDPAGSGDHFVQLPSAPPEVAPPPATTNARLIVVFDRAASAPPESWFFLRAVGDEDDELVLDGRTDQGAQHQLPAGWYTMTAYSRHCTRGCAALSEAEDICAVRQPVFANAQYLFRVDFEMGICELESQPPLEPVY